MFWELVDLSLVVVFISRFQLIAKILKDVMQCCVSQNIWQNLQLLLNYDTIKIKQLTCATKIFKTNVVENKKGEVEPG